MKQIYLSSYERFIVTVEMFKKEKIKMKMEMEMIKGTGEFVSLQRKCTRRR